MSEKMMRDLRELIQSVHDNSPKVERKLSSTGEKPDPAIVTSAAKYHKALELLAKE
jgi:hypothetical protein